MPESIDVKDADIQATSRALLRTHQKTIAALRRVLGNRSGVSERRQVSWQIDWQDGTDAVSNGLAAVNSAIRLASPPVASSCNKINITPDIRLTSGKNDGSFRPCCRCARSDWATRCEAIARKRLSRRGGWARPGALAGRCPWIDYWMSANIDTRVLCEIGDAFGGFAALINTAGGGAVRPSLQEPALDFRKTVAATVDMAEWVRTRSPGTVIVAASSAAVYGDTGDEPVDEACPLRPVSPYGFHKLMMEQVLASYAANFGVASSIVRFFSVYGPGLRKQLVYDLCSKLSPQPDSILLSGSGAETRDWLWIEDAARLLAFAVTGAGTKPLVVNGCTGRGTSVAKVAAILARLFGGRTKIEFDGSVRAGDPAHLVGSVGRLSEELGFRPQIGLEDGLSAVAAEWHRS